LNLIRFDRMRAATPMTDSALSQAYARFVDPISGAAIGASDDRVIEHVRTSIRRPVTLPKVRAAADVVLSLVMPTGSEVGIFGFDSAWLHYLLPPSRNSPRAAVPPTTPFFAADRSRLLDASYAIPEEEYLRVARCRFEELDGHRGQVSSRLYEAVAGKCGEPSLVTHQKRWHRVAAVLYRHGIPGGTVYRGFDQEQYDRLLTWASYSVMIPHAAALNALIAYATRDAVLARQQMRARALWWALVTTYTFAVTDPSHDGEALGDALPPWSEQATDAYPQLGPLGSRGRSLAAQFWHAHGITPLGDYLADNC